MNKRGLKLLRDNLPTVRATPATECNTPENDETLPQHPKRATKSTAAPNRQHLALLPAS